MSSFYFLAVTPWPREGKMYEVVLEDGYQYNEVYKAVYSTKI